MNKKISISIIVVVVFALVVGGVFYWKTKTQKTDAEQAAEDIQKIKADVSSDVGNNVSPDLTVPTVAVPETNANPYKETNPFSDLKTNPFQ